MRGANARVSGQVRDDPFTLRKDARELWEVDMGRRVARRMIVHSAGISFLAYPDVPILLPFTIRTLLRLHPAAP